MAFISAARCGVGSPSFLSLSTAVIQRRSWNAIRRQSFSSALAKSSRSVMGIGASTRATVRAMSSGTDLAEMIKAKNKENPVIVYSKSWCPYCSQVKGLFTQLDVKYKVIELDELADGDGVQSALAGVTGMRTVPQVFIGEKFVGGCDDTMAAYNSGKLKDLFSTAGVMAKF